MAFEELVAKPPRETCMNGEVKKIIGNIESLKKMWSIMDTWYPRGQRSISRRH
jgi:hypothetical protein